jgi:hypothetical protein
VFKILPAIDQTFPKGTALACGLKFGGLFFDPVTHTPGHHPMREEQES